jgi:hypothetical protein
MNDEIEQVDPLDVILGFFNTQRSMHSHIPRVPFEVRGDILLQNERNLGMLLSYLARHYRDPTTTSMVFNIPLSDDFLNSVPVAPTTAQIRASTTHNITMTEEVQCSICQEMATQVTKINHCNHLFHDNCLTQWFTLSPRCPVCRHDIREGGRS